MGKRLRFSLFIVIALSLLTMACGNNANNTNDNGISYEPETPPMEQSSSLPQEQVDLPDLTDLDNLTQTYLVPIKFSKATLTSWTDPNTLSADKFIDMYGYANVWYDIVSVDDMINENGILFYYVEELVLEKNVQKYFSVTSDHLRAAEAYNANEKTYAFNMMGVGFVYDPKVIRAEYDNSNRHLLLFLDGGSDESPQDEEAAKLTILINEDGGFRYVSNTLLNTP